MSREILMTGSQGKIPWYVNENGAEVSVASFTGSATSALGELLVVEPRVRAHVIFSYGINTALMSTTLVGTGGATTSNSKLQLSTGASTSSSALMNSRERLRYIPGQGGAVGFSGIFTTGVAGSTQELGIGDANDGYFFMYNGTSFGINRRSAGVDNFIAQTAWNKDKADGTGNLPVIDWTKGNIFKIQYQWYGFGGIRFFVEDPDTGSQILVHSIAYSNTFTEPSCQNPTLPLRAYVSNTTNNTNIILQTASMGAYTEGAGDGGVNFSSGNTKTSVGTSFTNIISFRNKSTYLTKTNRTPFKLLRSSMAADGTKPVEIAYFINTTLGGTPSWSDIDATNSTVERDTAGTTITGGRRIFTTFLGKTQSHVSFWDRLNIRVNPGETITLAGRATSGTSDISLSLAWEEQF